MENIYINKVQLQKAIDDFNSYPHNSSIQPVIYIDLGTGEAWESPLVGESYRKTHSDSIIAVVINNVLWIYGSITTSTIIKYIVDNESFDS